MDHLTVHSITTAAAETVDMLPLNQLKSLELVPPEPADVNVLKELHYPESVRPNSQSDLNTHRYIH